MGINQDNLQGTTVYGQNRIPRYNLYQYNPYDLVPNIPYVKPQQMPMFQSEQAVPDTPNEPVSQMSMPQHESQPKQKSAFWKSVGNGLDKLGSNVTGIIGFAGNAVKAFGPVKNQNELLSDAGTSNAYINGVAYRQQNAVDEQKEMSELNKENTSNTLQLASAGATLGSSLGPIGAAAGGIIGGVVGLFGGGHRKSVMRRRIWNAQQLAQRTNNSSMASANSGFLEQQEGIKYGTNAGTILSAYHGKDRTMSVQSSVGKILGTPNARVARDESIIDNIDSPAHTTGHIVRQGQRGIDGPTAQVNDNTVIFGNDIDRTNGIRFMDQAAPYTAAIEMINKAYGQK